MRKEPSCSKTESSGVQASPFLYLADGSLHPVPLRPADSLPRRGRGAVSLGGTEEAAGVSRLDGRAVPTDFKVLPDGSLIELVKDPSDPAGLRLLCWKNQTATMAEQIELEGQTLVPVDLDPSLITALCLPRGLHPAGDTTALFEEVTAALSLYCGLPDSSLCLCGGLVLSTWSQDRLPVAPYLWLTGPPGPWKEAVMRILHCLCYRSILVADVTKSGLYSLLRLSNPTLLIHEVEFNDTRAGRDFQRALYVGRTRGIPTVRRGQLFETFCAKVISSRQGPTDSALAECGLFIPIYPTRRPLRQLDAEAMERLAAYFQQRLLGWRLANYGQLLPPEMISTDGFSQSLEDLARALSTPLRPDASLQQKVIHVLEERNEEYESERHSEPEWVVVKALFSLCHERTVNELFVQEITDKANRQQKGAGEDIELKARRVGAIMKALGLKTKRLGSWGRGIQKTLGFRRKVHELARCFGITRRDITNWMAVKSGCGGAPCKFCAEFGLEAGLQFIKLPRKPRPSRLGLWLGEDKADRASGKQACEAASTTAEQWSAEAPNDREHTPNTDGHISSEINEKEEPS